MNQSRTTTGTACEALGRALRAARTARGLPRATLADRLLISESTLRRMEAGDDRVSLAYYLQAGEALEVPVLADHAPTSNGTTATRARRRRASDDWFE